MSVVSSVRRRDLVWAVALVMLLSAVWVARGDQAQAGGPSGDGIAVVYVAVGTGFPDSLGVGPAGGVNNAPIIIVPTNPPIPATTSTELVRLDPKTVVIVGGTAVVSDGMQDAIEALLPNAVVTRIGGANRYATNAAFSEAIYPIETWISIPAPAFTAPFPANDGVAITSNSAFNNSGGILLAPIQLPHGSEVLEFKIRAYDGDVDTNLGAYLRRMSGQGSITVASVGTSGSSGDQSPSTTSISLPLVDNQTYAYVVYLDGAGSVYIFNVMVRVRLGTP